MRSSPTPFNAEQLLWSGGQLLSTFWVDCGLKSDPLEKQLPPVAVKACVSQSLVCPNFTCWMSVHSP